MPRCIDQVEIEGLSPGVRIRQAHGLALDRDAPFPLDVHRVEDLVAEIPVFHQADVLDQTVGQGGFPVIDVGNDAEVSYVIHCLWASFLDHWIRLRVSELSLKPNTIAFLLP